MAKTASKGTKYTRVKAHTKTNGTKVNAHVRSTKNICKKAK